MNKNYNNTHQCNQQQKCNECEKNFWLGELNQMENYQEKGIFCDNCLNKIEKKCRRCDKLFVNRELTAKEIKEHEEWKKLLKEEYGKETKNFNLSLKFCHGSAPCHIKVNKDCHGHRIKQNGIFCSSECSNDYYKVINKRSRKFKEWKKQAEKKGWQRCQEKDCIRNPETVKWLLEDLKWDKKKLACWGYAHPGEKYCEDCKEERGEGQKNKEKSWQEDYRKYWNLTDENTYLSNRDNDKENSMIVSSNDIDLQDQIKNKERKLERLIKEDKSRSEVEKLRSEIQRLKSQQKNNSTSENSTKNNNLITYSVIGIGLVALAGLAVLLVKPKRKSPKIK